MALGFSSSFKNFNKFEQKQLLLGKFSEAPHHRLGKCPLDFKYKSEYMLQCVALFKFYCSLEALDDEAQPI